MIEQADDLGGLTIAALAKNQTEALKPTADDKNLIIIDGNNLGYRYLQRKNFNSFKDDYIRTVDSLSKSYQSNNTVVAYDFGRSAFRKNLFPEYKDNRKKVDQPAEEAEHFRLFFEELNNTQLDMPYDNFKLFGVEADDIITYLVMQLKDRFPHIWIVSSDKDLYQLLDDNVSIFNLFSRKEITKQWLWDEKGITPAEHMLSKIIQGDPGDNIKGIEGIGEKRGEDLAKTYKELGKLINSLPISGKSQYIKNLNAGKEILLRNEKLVNLTSRIREIISFGEKGEENFEILDHYVRELHKKMPKLLIDEIKLLQEPSVSIRTMQGSLS